MVNDGHRRSTSEEMSASSNQLINKSFQISLVFETRESVDDFAVFQSNDCWNSLNLQ